MRWRLPDGRGHSNDNPVFSLKRCKSKPRRPPAFGGIPPRRQKRAVLHDRLPIPVTVRRKELISRLLTGRCEWCAQRTTMAEVHHVRRLADLARPGRPQPAWAQLMAKRRRKTLVVCRTCHDTIHARQPTATPTEQSPESRMR
jgi:hypothetical protein